MAASRHQIADRVFIDMLPNSSNAIPDNGPFVVIGMDGHFSYVPFFEDFGPLNLLCVHRFCNDLREAKAAFPSKNILVVGNDYKSFTNAAFLIGAYLVIDCSDSPRQVMQRFKPISAKLMSYCDVSPGHYKFVLHLQDCWEAVAQAKDIGWLDFSSGQSSFDPEEYDHYASPLNADLNVIVPDKFIAMAGPVSFAGEGAWRDTASGCRVFSPHYALENIRDFDVQAVVRLNEPEYDETIMSRAGIAVVDLFFEDCSTPPPDVVLKFMTIAERLEGPIAVHCKAGLGRTGTLIALYLMKHHGFTARQAIAWLRIVRPGSVIGQQQDFLCSQDKHMPRAREVYSRALATASTRIGSSGGRQSLISRGIVASGAPVKRVQEAIAEIVCSVDRLLFGLAPMVIQRKEQPAAPLTRSRSASSLGEAYDANADQEAKRYVAGKESRQVRQGDGKKRSNLTNVGATKGQLSCSDPGDADTIRTCVSGFAGREHQRDQVRMHLVVSLEDLEHQRDQRPLYRAALLGELADHVATVAERRKATLGAWRMRGNRHMSASGFFQRRQGF